MGDPRHSKNLTTHTISIEPHSVHRRRDRERQVSVFVIHESRGGRINIDLSDFSRLIDTLNILSNIEDIKEKEKTIHFTENITFYRRYIKDTSIDYDYEIRISELEFSWNFCKYSIRGDRDERK